MDHPRSIKRKLIENNYEYDGDDPLFPWIKLFLQDENAGTAVSDVGANRSQALAIERYNDNLCYLKVWLRHLKHTYYALHLEFQPKVKTANEIFNLILSRNAKPMKC
ncbi:hypothetical protein F2Q69_00007614 [Brassica cretica]|uniref:Uncharacterized protein n=1 Tax=Brassica cretica TaxID=69181 RepID=A0A8S9P6J9_BRACR|nr:hypothetical protein F2Q69_00007614 [Brassica cretica]